ncbi:methyltransferase, TIGR04325 family [Opitutaceae bacterium EW11]|nr:methyltransferase, TIGR04325 family [Opitutaceae bacterium EW11]
MSYANLVRRLTPPLVWDFGKRRLPHVVRALGGHYTHIRFSGDYRSFAEARQASAGYDAPAILEKTREALLKVKRGQSRWERDAMVSDSEDRPWALLACLSRIAAAKRTASIHVLDFGGSLGSAYFWCRPFFAPEISVRWDVVEQPEHVKAGRKDFETEELRFAFRVEDVLAQQRPDVLLLSGVLHYLEEPEAFLETVKSWRIPYLLLDRTPLWNHARHRITVQQVPEEIYEASYPAWFLSRERILSGLETDYQILCRAPDAEAWEIDGEVVQNTLYFFQHGGV